MMIKTQLLRICAKRLIEEEFQPPPRILAEYSKIRVFVFSRMMPYCIEGDEEGIIYV